MKKLSILAVAFAAMTFAACGNGTANGGENDSVVADSVDTVEHNIRKDYAMIRTKDHLYEWTVRATNLK